MIDHTTHWIRDFMQSFLQLLWDRLVQFLNKSVLGQTCWLGLEGASFEGCNIGSSTGDLVATLIGKVQKAPFGRGVTFFTRPSAVHGHPPFLASLMYFLVCYPSPQIYHMIFHISHMIFSCIPYFRLKFHVLRFPPESVAPLPSGCVFAPSLS